MIISFTDIEILYAELKIKNKIREYNQCLFPVKN